MGVIELPKRSSGLEWSADEEDRLRRLWLGLCRKMEGRSEAAIRAKLVSLAERNYHRDWPLRKIYE